MMVTIKIDESAKNVLDMYKKRLREKEKQGGASLSDAVRYMDKIIEGCEKA